MTVEGRAILVAALLIALMLVARLSPSFKIQYDANGNRLGPALLQERLDHTRGHQLR
jgi:hypothetical protein